MLTGKTAIVTGAGRGIGRAIALKLGSLGANVILNYRSSKKETEELAEEIKTVGGDAAIIQGDVSNIKEAEMIVKFAVEKFGSLDILVNNAGITKDVLLLRMKEEDFDNVIDILMESSFPEDSDIFIAEDVSTDNETLQKRKLVDVAKNKNENSDKYFSIMIAKKKK